MKILSIALKFAISSIVIFLAGCSGFRYAEQPIANLAFDVGLPLDKTKISYTSDFVSYTRHGEVSLETHNNDRNSEFLKLITSSRCCQYASKADSAEVKIQVKITHERPTPGDSIKLSLSSGLYFIFPVTTPVNVRYEAYVTDQKGFVHYHKFSQRLERTIWLPMIFWTSKPKAESGYNDAMMNFHIQLLNSLKQKSVI